MKQKYRMTFKCAECGNVFRKITTNVDLVKAPCPECKKGERIVKLVRSNDGPVSQQDLLERDWEKQPYVYPPKSAESSGNVIKAIDETAKIVMEDHNMGDLRDNVRVGESMAPKLPPRQQRDADNMFSGGNIKRMIPNAGAMARTAMAGGYRTQGYVDPVATLKPAYKPKVSFVNKD